MRKTRLAAVAGAAFLAAVSLFSTVASAGVEKARLGALKKTDYVVVDVTGAGGAGGSYTGAVDAAVIEAALTNYLASGVIVSTNDLRFLRHVTDLGVYRYTVATNGPWTWSTDNDVLRTYLKDLTPVYVQGSAGTSGHWSLDGTLPSGLSISSYDTAGPETPTVTLGFSAVLTTNALVATATRPQFLAKSDGTLVTSDELAQAIRTRATTGALAATAQYATNIWTTLDSYIDYLEDYATNNYMAARLANYRALRLELWQQSAASSIVSLASSQASDAADLYAVKRDKTDNRAATPSYSEWVFGGGASGVTGLSISFQPVVSGGDVGSWTIRRNGSVAAKTLLTHTADEIDLPETAWVMSGFSRPPTATRQILAVPEEPYITYGPVTSLVGRTEAAIRATVLPDDVAALTNNVRFKTAVETVSPPVTDVVFLETDSSGDKTAVTLGSRPSLADVPVWSASSTYQQNDLVTKGGVLYVCTAWPDDPVGPSSWAEQSDDGVWKPVTVGAGSFAVGATNVADGVGTTAAGGTVHAEGPFAHAEGVYTRADGAASHAEGASTRAFGTYTHAEGASAMAGGLATHAEGGTTYADGIATHAEGVLTGAGSLASHAEGYGTAALGPAAKAEGVYATAGDGSLYRVTGTVTNYVAGTHAAGWGAVATNQTAFVWQGAPADRELLGSAPEAAERYYDHGAGTFNLNPVGGLQGIWIGSTNLYDHIVASSPPVVLPQKWALANVTNASGTAVSAADVNALPAASRVSDWPADIDSAGATYTASAKLVRDKALPKDSLITDWPADIASAAATYVPSAKLLTDHFVRTNSSAYVKAVSAGGNALEFTLGDGSTVDYSPSFEMSYPSTLVFKDPASSKISFWSAGSIAPSMLGVFVSKPGSTYANMDKEAIYYAGTPTTANDEKRKYYFWDGYHYTRVADADNLGIFMGPPLDYADAEVGHVYMADAGYTFMQPTTNAADKTRFYLWDGTRYTTVADAADYTDVVRTARTVNGYPLSTNVQLDADDVGAVSADSLDSEIDARLTDYWLANDFPADMDIGANYVASAKLVRDKAVLKTSADYVKAVAAGGNALEFTFGDGSTLDYEPQFTTTYPDSMVYKDPADTRLSFWGGSGYVTPSMIGIFSDKPLSTYASMPKDVIYYDSTPSSATDPRRKYFLWDGYRYTEIADAANVVSTSVTVNTKPLSSNVTLALSDVDASAIRYDSASQTLKTADGTTTVEPMDYEAMMNTVNDVKAKFYDAPLQTEWTVKMVNGEMTLSRTNGPAVVVGASLSDIVHAQTSETVTTTTVTLASQDYVRQQLEPLASNTNITFTVDGSDLLVKTNGIPVWQGSGTSLGLGSAYSPSSAVTKRYALFLVRVNPNSVSHPFGDIELKATTANFVGDSMKFYCATVSNGDPGYSETVVHDWCRIYVLSTVVDTDVRRWKRIRNTGDLGSYNPRDLAIIIDPSMFRRGQGTDWCSESNDELIWSYVRINGTTPEKDEDGEHQLWRPIMPIRWYATLPSWAQQEEFIPPVNNN